MTLILTADTNPGTSQWQDSGIIAGGGLSWVRKQILQADLPDAADVVIDFDDDLPAGAVITGWGIYGKVITFNPAITAGLRLILSRPWAGASYLPVYNATYTDSDQDYRPDGAWLTPNNVEDAVNFDNTAIIWPNFAAPPRFTITTADALTLTNLVTEFDIWVYVVYSVPVSFEFPPAS